MTLRAYHVNMSSPAEGEIFVFGSNLAGRHGKGAALVAVKRFGAHYGKGEGLMGQSYGIPTKSEDLKVLPLSRIKIYVHNFKQFARRNPDMKFFITRVGCGLAGYNDHQIAFMFKGSPTNCSFPESWRTILSPHRVGDKR